MEPLFVNDLTVDAAVLEEWQKKELATRYRLVYFTYGGLLLLCLVFIVTAVSIALQAGLVLAWVLAGALLAALGFLLWFVLTLPRRLVRAAMKKDKGQSLPYRSRALVFEESLRVQRNPPAEEARAAEDVAASLATAGALQARLQALAAQAANTRPGDTDELARLRGQLVEMKQQMEALSAGMARPEAEAGFGWEAFTGYERTEGLHGLFFGEAVVLLARGGFTAGNDQQFEALIKERLTEAAAGLDQPGDKQQRRQLEEMLRRYWPPKKETGE